MNYDSILKLSIIILIILLLIFIIFLLFFIKPKKFVQYSVLLLNKLPEFIKLAEDMGFTSGEMKKNYVFKLAIQYLVSISGCKVEDLYSRYSVFIDNSIEDILSTPQKKEVK